MDAIVYYYYYHFTLNALKYQILSSRIMLLPSLI